MKEEQLEEINQETINRYQERFEEHGESARSLGWGNRYQQRYRFNQFLNSGTFKDQIVMDVGCGFGDFLIYLREHDQAPQQYIGVEINNDFIEVAREKNPDAEFICGDPLLMDESLPETDTVIASGVFNYEQPDISNEKYLENFLGELFSLTKNTLLVDMISMYRAGDYPEEEWIHYYDPETVLSLGLDLTPRVTLKQDYDPIPQREMLLKLVKNP